MEQRLREYFYESLESFLDNCWQSIRRGVAEVNLCGALGMELSDLRHRYLDPGYKVDIEYDKMQGNRRKQIIDRHGVVHDIRCDLIVHSRGTNFWKDNLIAIEMKKSYRRERSKESDRERLRMLTSRSFDGAWRPNGVTLPHYVCDYELGYFIEIDRFTRSYIVQEFRNGEESFLRPGIWRPLPHAHEEIAEGA